MEHEEHRLVGLGGFLILDIFLVLVEEFRVKTDVAGLVDAMDVAEASGN